MRLALLLAKMGAQRCADILSFLGTGRKVRGRALLLFAATVTLVLALVVGCGSGGRQPQQGQAAKQRESNSKPQQEETKVREVPEYGDLRPGKYVTDEFEPAFSFEVVGEGWVVGGSEERGILDMRQGAEGPVLSFVNEQEVFDPSNPGEMDSVPAPKNLVTWLQRHPYLETEQPKPATIGGVKGVQLDAVVADDVPASECGDTCLGLFMVTLEIPWVVYEKEKVRFTVLEDVGGQRVTVAAEAIVADFEEFWPKAQEVIDTVEWEEA
jgi:hypothetical protein